MAKCKGCGAEIIWTVTIGGKRVPLDAKAEKRFVKPLAAFDEVALADTWVSHFVTCPKAGDFRKEQDS